MSNNDSGSRYWDAYFKDEQKEYHEQKKEFLLGLKEDIEGWRFLTVTDYDMLKEGVIDLAEDFVKIRYAAVKGLGIVSKIIDDETLKPLIAQARDLTAQIDLLFEEFTETMASQLQIESLDMDSQKKKVVAYFSEDNDEHVKYVTGSYLERIEKAIKDVETVSTRAIERIDEMITQA